VANAASYTAAQSAGGTAHAVTGDRPRSVTT
jgi:hypothetical protein